MASSDVNEDNLLSLPCPIGVGSGLRKKRGEKLIGLIWNDTTNHRNI